MGIKSAYQEIELQDGNKVKLTLNFAALYQLRSKDKKLYEQYNEIVMGGVKEELQNIQIIYIAYVCANISGEYMKFTEFLENAPFDREAIGKVVSMLLTPEKKRQDSQQRFREQQEK